MSLDQEQTSVPQSNTVNSEPHTSAYLVGVMYDKSRGGIAASGVFWELDNAVAYAYTQNSRTISIVEVPLNVITDLNTDSVFSFGKRIFGPWADEYDHGRYGFLPQKPIVMKTREEIAAARLQTTKNYPLLLAAEEDRIKATYPVYTKNNDSVLTDDINHVLSVVLQGGKQSVGVYPKTDVLGVFTNHHEGFKETMKLWTQKIPDKRFLTVDILKVNQDETLARHFADKNS